MQHIITANFLARLVKIFELFIYHFIPELFIYHFISKFYVQIENTIFMDTQTNVGENGEKKRIEM